jgi:AcrR family transcriptional regulator
MAVARMTRAEAKAQTRRRLLDAAREVFLRDGFHGATLERVAEHAGFTKGAVYSQWSSKAELFLALLDEHVERRRAQDRELTPREGTLGERAAAGARAWRELQRKEGAWGLVIMEFWLHAARDETLRAEFAVRQRALRAALAEATEEAFPEGEGSLSWAERALITMAMGNGITLERLVDPDVSEELYARAAAMLATADIEEERK